MPTGLVDLFCCVTSDVEVDGSQLGLLSMYIGGRVTSDAEVDGSH